MRTTKLKQAPDELKRGPGRVAGDGVVAPKYVGVYLDAATITELKRLGRGNLSMGIREAARRLRS